VQRWPAATECAQEVLGGAAAPFGDVRDNRLDTGPRLQVVQFIEVVIERVRPCVVLTHHAGDLNIDHETTALAVLTACRPVLGSSVREILAFEVASITGWGTADVASFQPTVCWDVKVTLERKIHSLRAYSNEMGAAPHARLFGAVQARAASWGSLVGVRYLEAFELVRSVREL